VADRSSVSEDVSYTVGNREDAGSRRKFLHDHLEFHSSGNAKSLLGYL